MLSCITGHHGDWLLDTDVANDNNGSRICRTR